jgi:hypothetical protein
MKDKMRKAQSECRRPMVLVSAPKPKDKPKKPEISRSEIPPPLNKDTGEPEPNMFTHDPEIQKSYEDNYIMLRKVGGGYSAMQCRIWARNYAGRTEELKDFLRAQNLRPEK